MSNIIDLIYIRADAIWSITYLDPMQWEFSELRLKKAMS